MGLRPGCHWHPRLPLSVNMLWQVQRGLCTFLVTVPNGACLGICDVLRSKIYLSTNSFSARISIKQCTGSQFCGEKSVLNGSADCKNKKSVIIEKAGIMSGWSFNCLKQDFTSLACKMMSRSGYVMRRSYMCSKSWINVSP